MEKRPETIEELRAALRDVQANAGGDPELAHVEMDKLLLDYINDAEVWGIYEDATLWYA
jgi:hypothetical protein